LDALKPCSFFKGVGRGWDKSPEKGLLGKTDPNKMNSFSK